LRIVWEFAKKDWRILRSYRLSFVLGIFATVYGIISFKYVSHLVGGTRYIGNSSEYFRFVVIGFVVAGVLRASAVTTATNARRDQVEGTLEILATQPIPLLALGLGWGILPVLEEIAAGIITVVIAVPLGFHGISPDWPATIVCLIVSALVFVAIGFMGAAAVLAVQQGVAAAATVTAVMTLVSGTAFPIAVMPGWLQALAKISPLYYALRATRKAVVGGSTGPPLTSQILILVGIACVLLPIGLVALRLSLDYARSRGSLARF
jgi:ABC-2 type transport system permease protein